MRRHIYAAVATVHDVFLTLRYCVKKVDISFTGGYIHHSSFLGWPLRLIAVTKFGHGGSPLKGVLETDHGVWPNAFA